MIAPDLASLATSLDDLTLYPGNPRKGDVDAIARSLVTFGQRKPIVATYEGVVVAGNHTLLAARQLGWSELAVVRVDDTGVMAEAYALADNRTAELGHYDPVLLAEMIRNVQLNDEGLMAAISYDAADLDDLLAALDEQPLPPIEHGPGEYRFGGGRGANSEGSFEEPSFKERLDDYATKGIRSLILDYPLDEYDRVLELCGQLRDVYGVDTNAEMILALLIERAG
jgi:hypothetical protein